MSKSEYLPTNEEIREAFPNDRNGHADVPHGTLSSPTDESAFLACLIVDPSGSGEALRKSPVRPAAFDDLRHRSWFNSLTQMIELGEPLTPANVLARFKGQPDAPDFYQILLGSDPFPLRAADFISRINDLYQRRIALSALRTADSSIRDTKIPLENSVQDISCFLDNLKPQAPALRERLKLRRFDVSRVPRKILPRYSVGNIPISTPGNISAISAAVKSGKSSWVGAMIAATISGGGNSCLGIVSSNEAGGAVIHIDTEQSVEDHDALIRTVLRRANIDTPPPWFHSYCITGFTIKDALDAIQTILSDSHTQCGSVHSMLIDGAADLVPDVNDPEACNSFVSSLHANAIEYDCSMVGVIHLNPGGEKTRGHLGSQLERKSESNIRLERDGDALICWSDKNRKAPILKDRGPRFEWSSEHNMHVLVDCSETSKNKTENSILISEAQAVFLRAEKSSLKWGEFLTSFCSECKISEGGARKRMDKMLRASIIMKDIVGYYTLAK